MSSVCVWTETLNGKWGTQCGGVFEFIKGDPEFNGADHCLYCGKPLETEDCPPKEGE